MLVRMRPAATRPVRGDTSLGANSSYASRLWGDSYAPCPMPVSVHCLYAPCPMPVSVHCLYVPCPMPVSVHCLYAPCRYKTCVVTRAGGTRACSRLWGVRTHLRIPPGYGVVDCGGVRTHPQTPPGYGHETESP